ncbi:3-hydroxybutyrate oligomer hydrolase family protein [Halomonas sp. HNIBRBA4712]|uniref:3-hydroxybutyrate oligomer hydrolase family protein n=1 Tax=Halomonas sp. HNIBRBA4712 TaxID=3373087 RepID=UPI003746FE71
MRTDDLQAFGLKTLSACLLIPLIGVSGQVLGDEMDKPAWLTVVSERAYDGLENDLATAGIGVDAMRAGEAPGYVDPLRPSVEELRRNALFTRATAGFGERYGPNVDAASGERSHTGIAGTELIALASSDEDNVSLLLQIPDDFDWQSPCVLAVPVAGSSSLFSDIATIGYWGLQKNCAVTYTDKGLGNGFHDLERDTVTRFDGVRQPAAQASSASLFTADLDAEQRQRFLDEYPHRIAFKHAHSQQNPDARWGESVLRSIDFAFYQLNLTRPADTTSLDSANTLVMVTGNSNGGGAALYAGEADTAGLIDGIVAAQPQVQLTPDERVTVTRGDRTRRGAGRSLMDYFTQAILYQPCAAVATPDAPMRDRIDRAEQRCVSLKARGLLEADSLKAQGEESLQRLRDYGWEPESDLLHASHYAIAPTATAVKYASSHGRFGVEERLCGYSFASVDEQGHPQPAPEAELAVIFATAPGGAPAGSIDIVNDRNPGGPRKDSLSASPESGREDYNLDGAMCLRELVTGDSQNARRVQAGMAEVQGDANLHGVSTIILHGRADARVPVGFTSRPYLALNSLNDAAPALHYYELTNVEHFGARFPGFSDHFVPIQPYHIEALELMYRHLREGEALPLSQVVRAAPAREPDETLRGAHLPSIALNPREADIVRVDQGRVVVPD